MRNLSNLAVVFALVAMMGLLVGCGCTTKNTPAREDMVNTEEDVIPPGNNTVNESAVGENTGNMTTDHETGNFLDENGNILENGVSENNNTNGNNTGNNLDNNGNVVDDAGNMVGDVVEDAGNAVRNVGQGVKNMTNDVTR